MTPSPKADRTDDGWIERFEAFALSKPARRRYIYVDINDCPIAQFLREKRHMRGVHVGPDAWFGFYFFLVPMWGRVPPEINFAILRQEPTFGALADRLAKLRESRS